jgi:hypothetical protein
MHKKNMKFAEVAPQIANISTAPNPIITAEVTDLIVKLAMNLNRQPRLDQASEKQLRYELDLYLGGGVLCRQAIKLAVALARMCQNVKDGKNKKQICAYLHRRINFAFFYTGCYGPDLLAAVAGDVKLDLKSSSA